MFVHTYFFQNVIENDNRAAH